MLFNAILLFFFQQSDLEKEVVSESLFDIVVKSGTMGIIIVVIQLILSAVAIYIFVERYLTIKRASEVDENFMNNIRLNVQSANIQGAIALCQSTDSPMARMVEKGLRRIGKPLEDINTAVVNVGNLEVFRLERNLSILASISGAAPMIGFLGTVTGMIMSFMTMAQGSVTPEDLAGGIYQALLTTAFGLFVGIFAYIAYNLLVTNLSNVLFKMEATSVEFIDLLQEPAV